MGLNRLYRVYVLPGELLFVCAGAGGELWSALARLVGRDSAGFSPAIAGRLRQIDQTPVEQLPGDDPRSFRAPPRDLARVVIDPYSAWHAALTWPGPRHVALLKFSHRHRGRLVMELPGEDDVRIAIERLPTLLGDKLTVNVR